MSDKVSQGLVKDFRKAFELNQEQASQLLSVHPMTVSKLERGKLKLDRAIRDKLLILMDVRHIPGIVPMVHHLLKHGAESDAFFVSMMLQKVTQL